MTHTVAQSLRSPMRLYESNYAKLMALVPELRHLTGAATSQSRVGTHLELSILEQCTYTTTIALSHCFKESQVSDLFLKVRLYHDAKVAETLGYQQLERIRPRYAFPNRDMLHRDEKRQINQLLADFLGYCLARGFRFGEVGCANA